MQRIDGANLAELADVEGFRLDFLRAHGFAVEGIDYNLDISPLGLPLGKGGMPAGPKAKAGHAKDESDAWRHQAPSSGGLV